MRVSFTHAHVPVCIAWNPNSGNICCKNYRHTVIALSTWLEASTTGWVEAIATQCTSRSVLGQRNQCSRIGVCVLEGSATSSFRQVMELLISSFEESENGQLLPSYHFVRHLRDRISDPRVSGGLWQSVGLSHIKAEVEGPCKLSLH